MVDVAVIGAGPAGSVAAKLCAEQGLQTIVLDKSSFPRYKTCGGGLIGRGLRFVDKDLTKIQHTECSELDVLFHHPSLSFNVKRDQSIVTMVMRDEFDHQLVKQAIEAGATFKENCSLQSMSRVNGVWTLKTNTNEIQTKLVLAADGALGKTAEKAGWLDDRLLIPAIEAEIEVSDDMLQNYQQKARFDFDCIPMGYAWVFPKEKHLSCGVLSMKRGDVKLKQSLIEYLDLVGIDPGSKMEQHGYVIPVTPRSEAPAKDGVFLLGDTYGLADAITAEGISASMLSGECVAKAIQSYWPVLRDVEIEYHKQLKDILLKDLAWSKRLMNWVYEPSMLRDKILSHAGQSLLEKLTSVSLGHTSFKRELCHPKNMGKLITRLFSRRA